MAFSVKNLEETEDIRTQVKVQSQYGNVVVAVRSEECKMFYYQLAKLTIE